MFSTFSYRTSVCNRFASVLPICVLPLVLSVMAAVAAFVVLGGARSQEAVAQGEQGASPRFQWLGLDRLSVGRIPYSAPFFVSADGDVVVGFWYDAKMKCHFFKWSQGNVEEVSAAALPKEMNVDDKELNVHDDDTHLKTFDAFLEKIKKEDIRKTKGMNTIRGASQDGKTLLGMVADASDDSQNQRAILWRQETGLFNLAAYSEKTQGG